MTIAKMSMNRNSSRYFKISVNGFENGCMSGIIYHAGTAPGIRFENYLEMMLHMNRIFDELANPKRTMDYRRFGGTKLPEPPVQEYDQLEDGTLATFKLNVKFRYNTSWQGEISWLEGQEKQEFESFLQMTYWIERVLNGPGERRQSQKTSNVCQIAVDSFEGGLLAGSVQNAVLNYLEDFTGTIALADAMGHFIGLGSLREDDSGGQNEDIRIIPDKMWSVYREGGKEATFLIKILFREHSTWQGVIRWRETGEKQAFRSFMELVLLMTSALESSDGRILYEDRYLHKNRESALMEG